MPEPRPITPPARLRLRLPVEAGRCYFASYHAVQRLRRVAPEARLVHGTIIGGGLAGTGHAWAEVGAFVYDGTLGDWFDRDDFYTARGARSLGQWTARAAVNMFERTGLWGPWPDEPVWLRGSLPAGEYDLLSLDEAANEITLQRRDGLGGLITVEADVLADLVRLGIAGPVDGGTWGVHGGHGGRSGT